MSTTKVGGPKFTFKATPKKKVAKKSPAKKASKRVLPASIMPSLAKAKARLKILQEVRDNAGWHSLDDLDTLIEHENSVIQAIKTGKPVILSLEDDVVDVDYDYDY